MVAGPTVQESNVDVLVIGAGPAGLMCAHGLKRAGVNVRVIDQRPKAVAAGQADGIQPRTIEVFQSYGLAERLLREGNQMHMAAFYNPSPDGGIERVGRAPDVTAATARYPFEVTLHQGGIEAIFVDSMEQMGLQVERPMCPTSIELSKDHSELSNPNAHPVKVCMRYLDNPEEPAVSEIVHAKYVVGADGAHSWVRKNFGIAMDGEQTDYIWGVVDMVPETDFPDIRNRTAIHSPNGSCMIIPREGDTVRLYLQLADKDVITDGRVDKRKMNPEKLLEVAKKSFHPFKISFPTKLDWWTIYIIGQRVASKFSVHDRVFIAGDACHTHSPKAGQGMNASMNDTHNLLWKLTHVLRGWADPSLLQTYESERRKYAQDLINFDKKFSALFSGKARTAENEDGVSHEEFLEAFQTFGGFTSGIGIHYGESLLVNTCHQAIASNLTIGMRMPPQVVIRVADYRPYDLQDLLPADTRFKILVFTGDITSDDQRPLVNKLVEDLGQPESFLNLYSSGKQPNTIFDIISIVKGKETTNYNYMDVPVILRSHWSKVFLDDKDLRGVQGGKAYSDYGIATKGAVVVVRPDGYVGFVAPLDGIADINAYFAKFMKAP